MLGKIWRSWQRRLQLAHIIIGLPTYFDDGDDGDAIVDGDAVVGD